MNLAYKILSTKLKSGELVAGQQIGIQIDQTLTQDSTGTMAYLQLEAMGIEHVAVEKAVAYIDHNMLQTGFENMDDHEFIRSVAKVFVGSQVPMSDAQGNRMMGIVNCNKKILQDLVKH